MDMEKENKIVKVDWIDSCSSNANWELLETFEHGGEIEPIHISTFGIIIQETKDCITIAQNFGVDPRQVCNLMTIPRGCIKQIQPLKIDMKSSGIITNKE